MANVFKPKRSSTASSVPTTSNLADGELAVNSADQKIYLRDGASVVEVGNVSTDSGGISDIVEDTTPQLGGNLDVNGKNINFGDSASASDDRLNFGAGTDLSIYFDGTNSYIDVDADATNHLFIRNNVTTDYGGNIYLQARSGENSIICNDDASVALYYDNAQKFTTTSTGFTVSGTGLGNFKAGDNQYLTAGTGDDFQIYHDGTSTYLDNDTGALYIRANVGGDVSGDIYIQAKSGENSIICYDDSSVRLYFDNGQKFTTTSTGFTVSGTGLGNFKAGDNQYLTAGAGDDFQIYHDETNTYLDNDTGHLFIRNNVAGDVGGNIYLRPHDNEEGIIIYDDGGVYLYYDNALKLYTTSAGVTISGTLSVTTLAFGDNQTMTFGAGDDLKIYHDGSNSYIDVDPDSNNQHLFIRNNVTTDYGGNIYLQAKSGENSIVCNDDTSVGLYYDNAQKLYTTSTGITVSGTGEGNWKAGDNQYLTAGAGDDLKIYHDGSNSYIDVDPDSNNQHLFIRNNVTTDYGGNIYLQAKSGENSIVCNDDTSVGLYYDNAQKLYTTSDGVTINGTLGVTTLAFADNQTMTFGASDDLSIYHYHDSGNNISISYIDNDTGDLYIRNNVGGDVGADIHIQAKSGEESIVCYDDSSVRLYFDNGQKLTTTSTGISVSGTGVGNWKAGDNQYLTAGAGDDLQIYHDGTDTYFDNDTGSVYIRNNVATDVGGDIYIQAKSGENSIACFDDSSTRLYFDGAQKLTTTSTGISVSGTCAATSLKVSDSAYITAGTGDDFQIYHDGTNTYLDNDTGALYIRNNVAADVSGDIFIQAKSGENSIACYDDSSTRLYFDGAQKLTTTSTGISVSGTGVGNWKADDSAYITAGTGDDLQIYHDGTNTYLDNDTGHLYIRNNVAGDVNGNIYLMPHDNENGIVINDDGEVQIYYDNAEKLNTSSTGVTVTGTLTATDVSVAGGHAIINNTGANIIGVTTSTSFVKSSNSGGFLKADGTEDTSTYLTTESQTLNDVLGLGNTSSTGLSVGVVTATNIVSVKSDDGTSGRIDLYCESNNAHYARLIAPAHANFSGNVTITLPNSTGTLLNSDGSGASLTGLTGASAATYGDSGSTPVITVDANGRITGITTAAPTTITRTATRIVATNGQTAFTVATYDSSFIDVYLNGVKLDSTEYATTNSTTITLTTGASTGDIFESVSYTNFTGANASSVTVADESSDTTCFPLFATAATGNVAPKSGSNLTFDSSAGILGATTFQGNLDVAGLLKEGVNIVNGKLSANTNIDLANGMVHFFDTTETTTSTPNIRVNASTTLNSSMNVGEAITVVLISSAAAAGYSAQLTIDGAAVTERWLGGSAPTAGGSSGLDVYTYTIIKVTSSPIYSVLANVVNFA